LMSPKNEQEKVRVFW